MKVSPETSGNIIFLMKISPERPMSIPNEDQSRNRSLQKHVVHTKLHLFGL